MRRNWLALLGLLMVFVLGAAACGGDDGGSSSNDDNDDEESSESISEEDWVEETSGLCEEWADDFGDLDGTDAEDTADFAEATVTFREDVEGLGEPEGIEDEAGEFLDALDTLADQLEQAAEEIDEDGEISDETSESGPESSQAVVDAAEELDLDCDLSDLESNEDLTSDFSDDFSDDFSSDFSDDFSSDFSDDFSDDVDTGDALDPTIFIPEYGSDPALDEQADRCFTGDFGACDGLYLLSPVSDSTGSYEGYGATCGGRLAQENPGACESTFGS